MPIALMASAMTDADQGGGGHGGLVLVVTAIVVLAGLCLWLLLRRGSIAHRADVDWPVADEGAGREPSDRPSDLQDDLPDDRS